MTITTVQFNVVDLAVKTILIGEALENVFGMDSVENIINRMNLGETFGYGVLMQDDEFEYAIYTLEKVANNIVDYYDMSVFSELSDYYSFDEVMEILENEYLVYYSGVHDMAEIAEVYVESCGMPNNWEFYIDEDALLHDLYCGGDIQDYYYNQVKEDALEEGLDENKARQKADNYEITDQDEKDYLYMALDCMGDEFKQRYFDYDALGRDMEIEGNYITCDNGIIEVTI